MKLKVKFLSENAKVPKKAYQSDAGFDLTSTTKDADENGNIVYGTGIAVFIPEGYVGLLFPRSSISKKTMALSNSVGVVDSGFTGELKLKFKPTPYYNLGPVDEVEEYEVGDRIAQLVILELPTVEIQNVDTLPESQRNEKGWGSSNY